MSTLYHYCSSSTFASILEKRSIWLSSLSLSNDSMEGRLVTQTFDRLLSQETVGHEEVSEIREAIAFVEGLFDGLGFCLSQEPDLLSQWRGYADDAQGFSIGFSKAYLEALAKAKEDGQPSIGLEMALYEPSEHENALKPTFEKIKELIESGKLKKPKFGLISMLDEDHVRNKTQEHKDAIKLLWKAAIGTIRSVYRLKNRAFKEEAEWRLLSYLIKEEDDAALFRAAGNRIIPYREIELKELGMPRISEVYIGPKNITPNHVIEKFLAKRGFSGVTVRRSSATYR